MVKWKERKRELFKERGWTCELCGSGAQDADHSIYPKAVGKRIDDKENLIALCRQCHTNKPPGFRRTAWEINVKRYGLEHMREWNNQLDLRLKLDW